MAKIIKNSSDLFRGFNLTQDMKSSYEEWFSQFRPLSMQERRQLIFITSVNLFVDTSPSPYLLYEVDMDEECLSNEQLPAHLQLPGTEYLVQAYFDWQMKNSDLNDESTWLNAPIDIPEAIIRNYSDMYLNPESKIFTSNPVYREAVDSEINRWEWLQDYVLALFSYVDWLDTCSRLDLLRELLGWVFYYDNLSEPEITSVTGHSNLQFDHTLDPVNAERFRRFLVASVIKQETFLGIRRNPFLTPEQQQEELKSHYTTFLTSPFFNHHY